MNTEQIEYVIKLVEGDRREEALRLLNIHLRGAKAEDRLAEIAYRTERGLPTRMIEAQTFPAQTVTPMSTHQYTMLKMWHALNPKIKTAELAAKLQKQFTMAPGPAFTLAARFKNELHTVAANA